MQLFVWWQCDILFNPLKWQFIQWTELEYGFVGCQCRVKTQPALLAIWYSVKLYHIEIGTIISSERCILCKPHSARHSLSPQTSEYHNNNLHADYKSLLYSLYQYYLISQYILVVFNNTVLSIFHFWANSPRCLHLPANSNPLDSDHRAVSTFANSNLVNLHKFGT